MFLYIKGQLFNLDNVCRIKIDSNGRMVVNTVSKKYVIGKVGPELKNLVEDLAAEKMVFKPKGPLPVAPKVEEVE